MVSVPSVLNAQNLTKSTVISSNEKDDTESLSIIYSTVDYMEEAEALAEGLLERGLVACISISTEVTSVYMWAGKMQKAKEVQMKMKVREYRQLTEKVWWKSNWYIIKSSYK